MDISRVFFIASIALLTGCAGFVKQPTPKTDANDESAIQLAEAAVSVSQSLNELAAMEKAQYPAADLTDPSAYNLPGAVSIDWSGPVEPLLQRLAAMSGYRLRVLGVKPAIPVLVTLTEKATPLAFILRNIDYQCGSKAKLLVYPAPKIIELRYAKS